MVTRSDTTASDGRAEARRGRVLRDERTIAQVRRNGGIRPDDGAPIAILETIGTVSHERHTKPVCAVQDGDDLFVVASAGGQRRHPDWLRNVLAHPDISIEFALRRYRVRASVEPNGPLRDEIFAKLHKLIPGLYEYQDRCRDYRQIPVVRLTPTTVAG